MNRECSVWRKFQNKDGNYFEDYSTKPHPIMRLNTQNLTKNRGLIYGISPREITASTTRQLSVTTLLPPLLFSFPLSPTHDNPCHYNRLAVAIYAKHGKALMNSERSKRLMTNQGDQIEPNRFCWRKNGHQWRDRCRQRWRRNPSLHLLLPLLFFRMRHSMGQCRAGDKARTHMGLVASCSRPLVL
jgi:hypothetical protein